jgi:hypothetical protein
VSINVPGVETLHLHPHREGQAMVKLLREHAKKDNKNMAVSMWCSVPSVAENVAKQNCINFSYKPLDPTMQDLRIRRCV